MIFFITYNNHTTKQICHLSYEKTYCNLCNLIFNNIYQYNLHKFSKLHFNNLDIITEHIDINPNNQLYNLDPYLDTQDKNDFNHVAGSGFTIVFNNGQKNKIHFNTNTDVNLTIHDSQISNQSNDSQTYSINDFNIHNNNINHPNININHPNNINQYRFDMIFIYLTVLFGFFKIILIIRT